MYKIIRQVWRAFRGRSYSLQPPFQRPFHGCNQATQATHSAVDDGWATVERRSTDC